MAGETLQHVAAALEGGLEADDALRAVVESLAGEPGTSWAGIAFLEGGELVLGPESGTPDEARRTRVRVSFAGEPVGELRVDGEVDETVLASVAELVSPYVLIGWDTRGESWEP